MVIRSKGELISALAIASWPHLATVGYVRLNMCGYMYYNGLYEWVKYVGVWQWTEMRRPFVKRSPPAGGPPILGSDGRSSHL